MTPVFIDPPSGWKYGFPKVWNGEGDMLDWLVAEGYPVTMISALGDRFFVRQWEQPDPDAESA